MASPENKLLQTWFAPMFKAAGFTKTAANWHRSTASFIHVFNIQGSQWSRSFYFNLGIYLTDLGNLARPTEADCHIRERLDGTVPNRRRLFELSDFEQMFPEEQRRNELQAIISSFAIPWLDRKSSADELRNFIANEKKHGLPITASVYDYLGITLA